MEETPKGWMVSAKLMISTMASAVAVLVAIFGACGWVIGLYNGVEKRLTLVEARNARMSDDIKEIKMMVSQLMMNRVDNRPEVQRWSK